MVFGICLLIGLYILWMLLVKGLLWKLILGFFGWCGMYWFLLNYPTFHSCPLNISGNSFSWASIIPTIITVLAMMHTKEE